MTTATHRHATSAAIAAVIAILVAWSVANIATMARVYHDSATVWLLGLGFGGANAISVYVLATANTKRLRVPAIFGALLFGGGSAIIQTNLYLHEGAALALAVAYGSLGPIAEAVLAWTEAALRLELAEESADTRQPEPPTATVTTRRPEPPTATATTRRPEPPTATATTRRPEPPTATADLTPTAAANLATIRQLAENGGWATDAQLAELAEWSETTARRYRQMAEQHSLIHRNGDGKYHAL